MAAISTPCSRNKSSQLQRTRCYLFLACVGLLTVLSNDELPAMPDVTCAGQPHGEIHSDGEASFAAKILARVPAYKAYHGCGPTSAASVLGYWDLHGYPDLFDAQGNDVLLTSKVQDHISSPEHNAKYDPKPDLPGPDPEYTSLADWFGTSVGDLGFGWSYISKADDAIEGYADFRGYDFEATNMTFGNSAQSPTFSWEELTAAIHDEHPLLLHVDSDGNGTMDHSVPVFGYDDRGIDGKYYAFYSSWREDEDILWAEFQGITRGSPWGVGLATVITPLDAPVPEPAAAACWLLLLGVAIRRAASARFPSASINSCQRQSLTGSHQQSQPF